MSDIPYRYDIVGSGRDLGVSYFVDNGLTQGVLCTQDGGSADHQTLNVSDVQAGIADRIRGASTGPVVPRLKFERRAAESNRYPWQDLPIISRLQANRPVARRKDISVPDALFFGEYYRLPKRVGIRQVACCLVSRG